jgi:hypothetical protein
MASDLMKTFHKSIELSKGSGRTQSSEPSGLLRTYFALAPFQTDSSFHLASGIVAVAPIELDGDFTLWLPGPFKSLGEHVSISLVFWRDAQPVRYRLVGNKLPLLSYPIYEGQPIKADGNPHLELWTVPGVESVGWDEEQYIYAGLLDERAHCDDTSRKLKTLFFRPVAQGFDPALLGPEPGEEDEFAPPGELPFEPDPVEGLPTFDPDTNGEPPVFVGDCAGMKTFFGSFYVLSAAYPEIDPNTLLNQTQIETYKQILREEVLALWPNAQFGAFKWAFEWTGGWRRSAASKIYDGSDVLFFAGSHYTLTVAICIP